MADISLLTGPLFTFHFTSSSSILPAHQHMSWTHTESNTESPWCASKLLLCIHRDGSSFLWSELNGFLVHLLQFEHNEIYPFHGRVPQILTNFQLFTNHHNEDIPPHPLILLYATSWDLKQDALRRPLLLGWMLLKFTQVSACINSSFLLTVVVFFVWMYHMLTIYLF